MYGKTSNRTNHTFLAFAAMLFASCSYANDQDGRLPSPQDPFFRNTVYAVGSSMKVCEPIQSGVPAGLWGNNEHIKRSEAVSPDRRMLTVIGTHEDRTQTTYRFFLQREDCLAFTKSNTTETAHSPNAKHVAKLEAAYRNRLHFESDEAARIVQTFNIDCRAPDGRSLPLRNLLYARLASMDSKAAWLEIFAQERGSEVRIIDSLRGPKIPADTNTVAFKINKWGEVRPVGITVEAVLNSCFGSYEPIWRQ